MDDHKAFTEANTVSLLHPCKTEPFWYNDMNEAITDPFKFIIDLLWGSSSGQKSHYLPANHHAIHL